ncbi:hypothetical protein AVEN_59614-1, partial [Araneus ventricosus]
SSSTVNIFPSQAELNIVKPLQEQITEWRLYVTQHRPS